MPDFVTAGKAPLTTRSFHVVVREVTEHTVYVNAPTKKEARRLALERRGTWGRDLRSRRVASVEPTP